VNLRYYVYAITHAGHEVPTGVPAVAEPEQPLLMIDCDALSILVSRISDDEIMATRRNMLAHTKVLEATMADKAVLPARFGIIAETPDAIKAAVLPQSGLLLDMLAQLEGRIEVGIRACWDEKILYRELVAANPILGRTGDALLKRNENESYYDRIELGRQVDSAMAVKRHEERRDLTERLKPLVVKHVHLPETDDMSVMNIALLVERCRENDLFREIQAIEAKDPARLQIKYVSPVPAYNFVKMRLLFAQPETALKGAA
jgi:Gas vesicle synthesis protein GvpL/GvpF